MKFLHTADWQIGKPFARISDENKRALVRNARIEAIVRIGDVARETGAEFIVVAGDLFDSPSADKATVSAACSAMGKLGMPVYVIPGNHDHGGPRHDLDAGVLPAGTVSPCSQPEGPAFPPTQ